MTEHKARKEDKELLEDESQHSTAEKEESSEQKQE